MTETSPVCFLELTGLNPGSIGKNVKGCEARLVDPLTNKDVQQPGETGEFWVRGPHIMKGYLNNDVATREMITDDGWLKTGDIGYYDKDQLFFVTDRLKELIKVKGFQVSGCTRNGIPVQSENIDLLNVRTSFAYTLEHQ